MEPLKLRNEGFDLYFDLSYDTLCAITATFLLVLCVGSHGCLLLLQLRHG